VAGVPGPRLEPGTSPTRRKGPLPIDIAGVDYLSTASTWDVMYCRQRRHLYYGGENLKYYLTPSPAVLPS
jgi:hypothetical protein